MHAHQMTTASDVEKFVTAGKAIFTLRSGKTGNRFTFRVRKSEDGNVRFVQFMNGPDNHGSYAYLGVIGRQGDFRMTEKSKATPEALVAKAFTYFWKKVSSDHVLPSQLEVWHEGKCGRCGRRLTVPESIESGLGPECINHV